MNSATPEQIETLETTPTDLDGLTVTEPAPASPEGRKRQYTTFRHGVTTANIINCLAVHPMTPGPIAERLGMNRGTVIQQLLRLHQAGKIVRLGRGLYGLGFCSQDAVKKAATFNLPTSTSRAFLVVAE